MKIISRGLRGILISRGYVHRFRLGEVFTAALYLCLEYKAQVHLGAHLYIQAYIQQALAKSAVLHKAGEFAAASFIVVRRIYRTIFNEEQVFTATSHLTTARRWAASLKQGGETTVYADLMQGFAEYSDVKTNMIENTNARRLVAADLALEVEYGG